MSPSVARNRCGLPRREDGPHNEARVSRDLHVHGLCGRGRARSQLTRARTTPPSRSLRARPATGREKWGFRVLGLTFWTVGSIASLTLDRLRLTARLPPPARHQRPPACRVCLSMDGKPRLLLLCPATQTSLLVDDPFVISCHSRATEQLQDRSDRLTGHPPRRARNLGSEGRNAAVTISTETQSYLHLSSTLKQPHTYR